MTENTKTIDESCACFRIVQEIKLFGRTAYKSDRIHYCPKHVIKNVQFIVEKK